MRFGLRELVFVLVLAGLPLGAWWFVFKPNNEQIREARSEIQTKRQKLATLEREKGKIDDLKAETERLRETIEVFNAKLPAEQEVDKVLSKIAELAKQHRLKTRKIRTEKLVHSELYTELPLKMVIVGNFDGYYSFLLDLEKEKRITRVPEMKLLKLRKSEEGLMEATFTLSIFFEPKKKNPNRA